MVCNTQNYSEYNVLEQILSRNVVLSIYLEFRTIKKGPESQ
jgi:hypothetical protein